MTGTVQTPHGNPVPSKPWLWGIFSASSLCASCAPPTRLHPDPDPSGLSAGLEEGDSSPHQAQTPATWGGPRRPGTQRPGMPQPGASLPGTDFEILNCHDTRQATLKPPRWTLNAETMQRLRPRSHGFPGPMHEAF